MDELTFSEMVEGNILGREAYAWAVEHDVPDHIIIKVCDEIDADPDGYTDTFLSTVTSRMLDLMREEC